MKKEVKVAIFWVVFVPIALLWDIFFFSINQLYVVCVKIDQLGDEHLDKLKDWYESEP